MPKEVKAKCPKCDLVFTKDELYAQYERVGIMNKIVCPNCWVKFGKHIPMEKVK